MSTGDRSVRVACVVVPALPLQLLLRQHPGWQDHPSAVVSEERPDGLVQWVNRSARQAGVLPGARLAAALSLAPQLRAAAVPPPALEAAVEQLCQLLQGFAPRVEPYAEVPGVAWLDATGLRHLYPSLQAWADQIRAAVAQQHLRARVAVGFSRFGSFAAAAGGEGTVVFESTQHEGQATARVPLRQLDLPPAALRALGRLGIDTVGELVRLPGGGLRSRFGPELHRLHTLAAGDPGPPLDPRRPPQPICARVALDFPEHDTHRLLFVLKRHLAALLQEAAGQARAAQALRLGLTLEGRAGEVLDLELRPAAPTLDQAQLLDLLRLRLERLQLRAGVVELRLELDGVRASRQQLQLFAERPRRDLRAAEQALARLRAEHGPDAVVWARLRPAHLPEARVAWEPLEGLRPASPRPVERRSLVRSLYDRPLALPPRLRLIPQGWLLHDRACGAVQRLQGPHVVSGGWWVREVHRDYYFAEMQQGQLLWIFCDRRRRRWFVHGEVR